MESGRIFIQHEQIEDELPKIRENLRNSGISEEFAIIDRGDYGYTILALRLMSILEISLAVFVETSKQLKNIILKSRATGPLPPTDSLCQGDIIFINIYSLYCAAVQAIEECAALNKVTVKVNEAFKKNEILALLQSDTKSLPGKIAGDFKRYLDFYKNHSSTAKRINNIETALSRTTVYFELLKNSLEQIVRDSEFTLYRNFVEGTQINILGKNFQGFNYSREDYSENGELMKVAVEDIIGNKEYISAALKLARDVAGFDFAIWENPKNINPVLFAMGNPGCGKTVAAHAVGNYFLDFCKKREIPSRFVIIRRSDWASSYQNASANQLIEIFKKNILNFKGVVGIYWPDIDTAFAARDDAGLRNEEKNVLGAMFGLFDGTILPKNGQWFMICDANYLNMDKATISRITQDPYFVKGPETPADFVNLMKDVKLRKHKDFLDISEEEWLEFGKKCLDNQLSGRSIDNMSRKAISIIEDFEYPEEYFKADYNRKKEIIKEYSKHLTIQEIHKITENYMEFEKDAEEKSAKQRFHDRVKEITTYLSAEKYARQALLSIE